MLRTYIIETTTNKLFSTMSHIPGIVVRRVEEWVRDERTLALARARHYRAKYLQQCKSRPALAGHPVVRKGERRWLRAYYVGRQSSQALGSWRVCYARALPAEAPVEVALPRVHTLVAEFLSFSYYEAVNNADVARTRLTTARAQSRLQVHTELEKQVKNKRREEHAAAYLRNVWWHHVPSLPLLVGAEGDSSESE